MSLNKYLNPRNDLCFKRIFGTEKNKDILIHFLNDIFGRVHNRIEDITFLSSSQIPEVAAQRVSLVDVMCQDIHGHRFIVEIQVAHESGFTKRAQYYAAKAYIEQRSQDCGYKDLKEVMFLAITDFTLFKHKPDYLSHHQILDTQTHEHDLKGLSFSFLELPKFIKSKDQLTTLTDKWAYFFRHADNTHENDLQTIIGDDSIIKRAYDELNRYHWSIEELRTYDSADMKLSADKDIFDYACQQARTEGETIGLQKGEAIGLQKGKVEGMKEGKTEAMRIIVSNMIAQGFDESRISMLTGLSIAEIKLLKL